MKKRRLRAAASLMAIAIAVFLGWFLTPPPPLSPSVGSYVVREVTGLVPVEVEGVVRPRTVADVQHAVRTLPGPICVGGGRFSMGGQTATEGCTQLDMRRMDRVLAIDPRAKTARVQAGITWRALQSALDRHDLSVRIMQTYSSFTVGGSLGVNVHGRYVGEGPLVRSVRDIRVVLADGTIVDASPTQNQEVFYGAIGGYGGLGVIVEATLELAENAPIERWSKAMPVSDYAGYFGARVGGSRGAVFHNGDLYPPDFDEVRAVTWRRTRAPLTETRRLQPRRTSTFFERTLLWLDTSTTLGKRFRAAVWDPIAYLRRPVVLRNFEASYDARELEPFSRDESTYVLQEYFVPVERFDAFVPKLRRILARHEVNAINLSIRHARHDPGTLLAWARSDVFSFVLYHEQGTSYAARKAVGEWTRELVDAALEEGGAFYLPYQPHATPEQLRRAYPRWDEWITLRRRLDPEHRFRNRLLDRYDPPWSDDRFRARRALHARREALRNEEQTFLTVPEWYIVFAAEEYARHLTHARPSAFPYFGQIGQLWSTYRRVFHRTRDRYPWNGEYHTMIAVIATSFSIENVLKGAYENTVGRLTELFADTRDGAVDTEEDRLAARVAADYDAFVRVRPWYEFPFGEQLDALWALDASKGSSYVRAYERRLALSLEYAVKAGYASLIGRASQSAYGAEESTTTVWLERPADVPLPEGARSLARFGDEEVVELPRYEAFRGAALALVERGARFREIAGNDVVAVTLVAERGALRARRDREVLARWPVLTTRRDERVLVVVRVRDLHELVADARAAGASVDHVFDH